MDTLFDALSRSLDGSLLLALAAALAWGVLGVLLSPCHLSAIPLVIAFVGEASGRSTRRALRLSLFLVAGSLVTLASIGALTIAAGRLAGDLGRVGNTIVAALFVATGLWLLDLLPLPSGRDPARRVGKRRGPGAAFLIGLLFGFALGPCAFALLTPLLAVAFRVSQADPTRAALLLGAWAAGYSAVLVAAGTSAQLVQRWLDWTEGSRGATILRRGCGLLAVLGGLWLLWTAR